MSRYGAFQKISLAAVHKIMPSKITV